MVTELNNVNIYCYRLQGNPSYCRLAICAENKEKAYTYAMKKFIELTTVKEK